MPPAAEMTLEDYLAALPAERQQPAAQAWELVRRAMPAGYTEHIGPKYLEFRAGKDMYVGLANQKGYLSLHLVAMYLVPALQEPLAAAAPKLKMGKGCVNFTKLEELPQQALSELIGATLATDYVAQLQQRRAKPQK